MTDDKNMETQLIEIELSRTSFKKALSGHKKFVIQGKNVEGSPLSLIKFSVQGEKLKLYTTDGSKALISTLEVLNTNGVNGEFYLSMTAVSKIAFLKCEIDLIRIKQNTSGEVEIIDDYFSTRQTIKQKEGGNFPCIERCLPDDNNFTISVAQSLIKDIASLKNGVIDLSFNTRKGIHPICAYTGSEEFSQEALLMPIDKSKVENP